MDAPSILRRLAGWPWRWCLRRADAQFKTDAEGQHVYFPYGIHSAGRIAPNEAEYVRLRNAIAWLLVAMPVVVPLLFLWFSLVPIWVYVLTAGPAAAAFWILDGRRTWMRWPASAERLTLRDVDERSPWMYRSAWFLLLSFRSGGRRARAGNVRAAGHRHRDPWVRPPPPSARGVGVASPRRLAARGRRQRAFGEATPLVSRASAIAAGAWSNLAIQIPEPSTSWLSLGAVGALSG